eukprot:scaffold85953_cov49-Tisochrysis_lutea.AAC.1
MHTFHYSVLRSGGGAHGAPIGTWHGGTAALRARRAWPRRRRYAPQVNVDARAPEQVNVDRYIGPPQGK